MVAVVLIEINSANMQELVPDREKCLFFCLTGRGASAAGTWHLHMHLHLQTGYPQPVRLQGHYATDGEDAQLAEPGCIVKIDCRRKRPESCMGAHKCRTRSSPTTTLKAST